MGNALTPEVMPMMMRTARMSRTTIHLRSLFSASALFVVRSCARACSRPCSYTGANSASEIWPDWSVSMAWKASAVVWLGPSAASFSGMPPVAASDIGREANSTQQHGRQRTGRHRQAQADRIRSHQISPDSIADDAGKVPACRQKVPAWRRKCQT